MNQLVGVGCDLVDIERIKEASLNSAFIKKILTKEEHDYCFSFKEPYSHIAARFAAKEAVSKALGVGISKDLKWHDIQMTHDERKKPHVILSHEALIKFSDVKFEISLSHTDHTAAAFVIAYR